MLSLFAATTGPARADAIEVDANRVTRCCPPNWNGDWNKCLNFLLKDGQTQDDGRAACLSMVGTHWLVNPVDPNFVRCSTVQPSPPAPHPTDADAERRLLAAAPPSQACYFQFLKQMGWQVNAARSGTAQIQKGNPCEFDSLEDAHDHYNMQINIPDNASAADLAAIWREIPSLVLSPQTMCSYKFRVRDAANRAADRLSANTRDGGLEFTRGHGLFETADGTSDDWSTHCLLDSNCPYRPDGSNSAAIEAFYHGHAYMDCAVGLQTAQYATLYELFGAHDFDRVFNRDEIALGDWNTVDHHSDSVVRPLGNRGLGMTDGALRFVLNRGRGALLGVPGYLGNVNGEDSLDDKPDRGENFMITDVSRAAGDELRDHGLSGFNQKSRRLWEDTTRVADKNALRLYLQRLGEHPDAEPPAGASDADRQAMLDMRATLNDPLFREIKVWVHPLGQMTFAEHVTRLANLNPRTPYRLSLYYDNVNVSLFQRYVHNALDKCMAPEHL